MDQVRERLAINKRKLEDKSKPTEGFNYDAHIAALQDEESRAKVRMVCGVVCM